MTPPVPEKSCSARYPGYVQSAQLNHVRTINQYNSELTTKHTHSLTIPLSIHIDSTLMTVECVNNQHANTFTTGAFAKHKFGSLC